MNGCLAAIQQRQEEALRRVQEVRVIPETLREEVRVIPETLIVRVQEVRVQEVRVIADNLRTRRNRLKRQISHNICRLQR